MVSGRYFCLVGEFSWRKGIPGTSSKTAEGAPKSAKTHQNATKRRHVSVPKRIQAPFYRVLEHLARQRADLRQDRLAERLADLTRTLVQVILGLRAIVLRIRDPDAVDRDDSVGFSETDL